MAQGTSLPQAPRSSIHPAAPRLAARPTSRLPAVLQRKLVLDQPVLYAVSAPDGIHTLLVMKDWSLQLWDIKTNELQLIRGTSQPQEGEAPPSLRDATPLVKFAPDGRSLAFVGPDEVIHLCSLSPGQDRLLQGTMSSLAARGQQSLLDLSFSRDGQTIVAGGRVLEMWNLRTGVHRVLQSSFGYLDDVAFSPDRTLVAINTDKSDPRGHQWQISHVEVYEISTGKRLWAYAATYQGYVISPLAFSPDSLRLAGFGSSILLWDAHTGKLQREIRMSEEPNYTTLDWTHNGKSLILTARQESATPNVYVDTLVLLDTQSGQQRWATHPDKKDVSFLGFTANDTFLVSDSGISESDTTPRTSTVRIWDAKTGHLLQEISYQVSLELSPDGKSLLTRTETDKTPTITLWHVG